MSSFFYNPRILDRDGNPYKPVKELTRVGIFRVRDLAFRKGKGYKNYTKTVYFKIKEIKDSLDYAQGSQNKTGKPLFKIWLEGEWNPFCGIVVRNIYNELQKEMASN